MFLIVNLRNGRRIPTTKHIRGLKAPALILDDCFEDLEFPNACVLGIPRTGENSAVSASDLFPISENFEEFSVVEKSMATGNDNGPII